MCALLVVCSCVVASFLRCAITGDTPELRAQKVGGRAAYDNFRSARAPPPPPPPPPQPVQKSGRPQQSVQINFSPESMADASFAPANISDPVLHAWGRDFVAQVLTATPWDDRWRFVFQMPEGKDPWVVFHIGSARSAALRRYEKAYHGCPLSIAQAIIRSGFIIGESGGLWYCGHGLLGYGRWHALERSSWRRGWLEQDAPCLWTQAVTVSFAVASECSGSGHHEPVGLGVK